MGLGIMKTGRRVLAALGSEDAARTLRQRAAYNRIVDELDSDTLDVRAARSYLSQSKAGKKLLKRAQEKLAK